MLIRVLSDKPVLDRGEFVRGAGFIALPDIGLKLAFLHEFSRFMIPVLL
jgi:hypothetical protein